MRKGQLRECLRIAGVTYNKHTSDSYRLWAFVWQGGNLIEWGMNKKYGDGLKKFGYGAVSGGRPETTHAEVAAYRKAVGIMDNREPWSVVCIRLKPDMSIGMSCPCKICTSFLRVHGCQSAYFTTDSGDFAKVSYF